MTAREAFDKICWTARKEYTAQLTEQCGLSLNLEDFFTRLIKDAARTNRFSSDIRYTLNEIEDQLREFKEGDEWKPIFIGFRRDGVDGTSFVLSTINNAKDSSQAIRERYFAFYGIDVKQEKDYRYFYRLSICEYWT